MRTLALVLAVVGVVLSCTALLLVAHVQRRQAKRARLDAAVRAQALVELLPDRTRTVRGASRDRSLHGKARRLQRQRDRLPLDSFDVAPPRVSDATGSNDFDD